jgi:hypothetical protein
MKPQEYPALLKLSLIVIVVGSVTFLAYFPALKNEFQTWDTWSYITGNPNIKALTSENIWWMFTSFHASNWHPLTWLSHALDYSWFGENPRGHHLVSIIIHCLNTVLLFVLLSVITSFKPLNKGLLGLWPVSNKTIIAAAVASLLFGIHPQHVESVVWVAERKDLLCLFFILLTLLSYTAYSVVHTTKTGFYWYLAALLFFALALLSKPMAVTIPVVLLLIDIYPLNRTGMTTPAQQDRASLQKLLVEKIPFFVLTFFSIILTVVAQHQGGALSSLDQIGILSRILNAFNSILFYISKFVFPIGLSPFYPYPSYDGFDEYAFALIPVVAFFLITFVCFYMWRKQRYYWFTAWLFYLITLSPVLGIIQVGIQAAADRYVYFPTIPFYMLVGSGVASLLYARKVHKFMKPAMVIIFLFVSSGLVLMTHKQIRIWENDETFWSYIVAHSPQSAFAQFQLANRYLEKGEYEKAVIHYSYAILAEPDDKWAINLPIAYISLGRLQEAEHTLTRLMAYNAYETQLDYFYHMRGWIYLKQGRLEEARKILKKSIQLNPDNKVVQDLLLQTSARQQDDSL